jgi:hypothetical protein
MAQTLFMNLGMHIMAHQPISTEYFINSYVSLCVYVYLPIAARQRLGKIVTAAKNINEENIKIVRRVLFSAIRDIWKESRRLTLLRTSCFS